MTSASENQRQLYVHTQHLTDNVSQSGKHRHTYITNGYYPTAPQPIQTNHVYKNLGSYELMPNHLLDQLPVSFPIYAAIRTRRAGVGSRRRRVTHSHQSEAFSHGNSAYAQTWLDHRSGRNRRKTSHKHSHCLSNATTPPLFPGCLELNKIKRNDSGTYTCRVEFLDSPTQTHSIHLTVYGQLCPIKYTLLYITVDYF